MALGTAFTADFTELAGVVASFEKRGNNLGRLMPEIAQILVSAVDDVYDAEGSPKWEPLAESTMARRRGTSYKILQDTGVMAASTMPAYFQDMAEAWANDGKAKYHAEGNENLPRRNPFDLGSFEAGVLSEVAALVEREAVG